MTLLSTRIPDEFSIFSHFLPKIWTNFHILIIFNRNSGWFFHFWPSSTGIPDDFSDFGHFLPKIRMIFHFFIIFYRKSGGIFNFGPVSNGNPEENGDFCVKERYLGETTREFDYVWGGSLFYQNFGNGRRVEEKATGKFNKIMTLFVNQNSRWIFYF